MRLILLILTCPFLYGCCKGDSIAGRDYVISSADTDLEEYLEAP